MRWEYMLVEAHVHVSSQARYLNGSEIPNWKKGPHISVFLNQLGDEGWELVSWIVKKTESVGLGMTAHDATQFQAMLKRQKP